MLREVEHRGLIEISYTDSRYLNGSNISRNNTSKASGASSDTPDKLQSFMLFTHQLRCMCNKLIKSIAMTKKEREQAERRISIASKKVKPEHLEH